MKYCIGIDLGTSAVKVLLVNQHGTVVQEVSKPYPLIQEKSGFMEQNPEAWVEKTIEALKEITLHFKGSLREIEGLSFSGQMHGLVLLDGENQVLRNAILWNDTRASKQCQDIISLVGEETLLKVTRNLPKEGFTLPKLLWVKENEPDIYSKAAKFLLPKDYLRYRLTGKIQTDYSDAAGTLLLNVIEKKWSREICDAVGVSIELCPPLVESGEFVGYINSEISQRTGLSEETKVFAGGADNACGAIGSGILQSDMTLCSIGTSGVVLSFEEYPHDYKGQVHLFNHGQEKAFYSMGVTLSAGYSLSWFKEAFARNEDFVTLLEGLERTPIGANGLLFTPYLVGERTPQTDSVIRGSFIGIDATHRQDDFVRSVVEGITLSLNETVHILREKGKKITTIISIGGGAKNKTWLQIQADVFNVRILTLENEQGPSMGAAMLAAVGCGWFSSLQDCAQQFIKIDETYQPIPENVQKYERLFTIYKKIYKQTRGINEDLLTFR